MNNQNLCNDSLKVLRQTLNDTDLTIIETNLSKFPEIFSLLKILNFLLLFYLILKNLFNKFLKRIV